MAQWIALGDLQKEIASAAWMALAAPVVAFDLNSLPGA